jgi:hypothetical protein
VSSYAIAFARHKPELKGMWTGCAWQQALPLEISQFRPESSDHHPRTQARLLYDETHLYGIFRVDDCYVRCVHTAFQDPTYLDSCVELFIQPDARAGYFNFEFNAGGALAVFYIHDATRTTDAFEAYSRLSALEGSQVEVFHSLPAVIEPEIGTPVSWTLEFSIPLAVLAKYVDFPTELAGQDWRGNLFKCGDGTSHPHWAAWCAVDELNFHLPHCFGGLHFEPPPSI